MVTGATGYVAGLLVKRLLEEGLTVHAPVRDPNNPEKLKYLNKIAAAASGDIKYFKADLLDDGSYAQAMAGCELVFHTASPFKVDVKDPQEELVEPAKLGTRNVLEQTNRIPSVKRIVLTSSCAAIYGDNADLEKTPGIIAVLGAGNYSSALEMLKAIFFENCAVVHKPHHLNAETDKIWAKIMQPLVDHQVLYFADHNQGRELTTDPRLSKIYFTGGTGTAKAIMSATDTELISECGGNNPCIIVPGDRPWTDKEFTHQVQQIVTINKFNGGAVCGRVQTLVTSRHWPQREAFLDALRKAIVEDTPADGTYYPGSDKVVAGFLEAYPDAEILKPENGQYKSADFLLLTGAEEESYATANEAFCQIIDEVPLDVPANAAEFLPRAVGFCNTRLLGTLGSCILIDEDTKKAHQAVLDQAVTDLEYGAVAVNTMPPFIFLSPWLTWGGNEEGKEFVSGVGNFGNAMNFENVEKSIMNAGFMSPGHMLKTNKSAFDTPATEMSNYAVEPSWKNLTCLMGGAIVGGFRKKDF